MKFSNKKNIIVSIIILFISSISIYLLNDANVKMNHLKVENKTLQKKNKSNVSKISKLEKQLNDSSKHVIPTDGYISLYIDSREKAFQAFLNAYNLKTGNPINFDDLYVYHKDDNFIGYTDQAKSIGYIVFDNTANVDNDDYYMILVKISEQIQNGGSGTAANIHVYKDGYITGI